MRPGWYPHGQSMITQTGYKENCVVVYDDSATDRQLIQDAVHDLDVKVEFVNDISSLIEYLFDFQPDLVLLGVKVGDEDACQLCTQIRDFFPPQELAIVLMLEGERVDEERIFNAGANDFFYKPLKPRSIHQRVGQALNTKQLYEKLRNHQMKLEQAQRMAKLIYWEFNVLSNSVEVSSTARELFLIDITTIKSYEDWLGLVHPDDYMAVRQAIDESIWHNRPYFIEHRIQIPNLGERTVQQQGEVIETYNGSPLRLLNIMRDVTSQRQSEEELHMKTYYDALTGLPSRQHYVEAMQQAMVYSDSQQLLLAVFTIGIDRFSKINESLGRQQGDGLLCEIAQRLQNLDSRGLFISRLESDVFGLYAENIHHVNEVEEIGRQIIKAIERVFHIDEKELYITCSVGVALYPLDEIDAESVMEKANSAMHRAKMISGSHYSFYANEMDRQSKERIEMESALRKGIREEQFVLYYQPQVDLREEKVVGVEALVRWQHPQHGLLGPDQFIPIAEESGLIISLGHWVLCEACRQVSLWAQQGLPALRVGVNLSAKQLHDVNLIDDIRACLHRNQLSSSQLEIEVTESIAVEDIEKSSDILQAIRDLGVKTSMDDFGTGFSSLSYLQRLPLDTLKIDRAFVKDINAKGEHGAFSKAIVAMAHSLGLHVIAEGVETRHQFDFLREHGVDEMQGYYCSKPLEAEALVEYLGKQK